MGHARETCVHEPGDRIVHPVNDLPSIRNRVTGGTILLLLLVFVMTLIGVRGINSLDRDAQRELGALRERTILAQTMTRAAVDAVRTGDLLAFLPTTGNRSRLDSAVATIRVSGEAYARFDPTPAEVDAIRTVTDLASSLGLASPGAVGANETRRSIVADSLLTGMQQLVMIQEGAAAERATALASGSEKQRTWIWILFMIALIIGIWSAVTTVRNVILPLRRLVEATERVGAGDLRPLDLGPMPRELALLAAAVRRMSESLRAVVGSVAEVSATLTDRASQLSSRSEQLSESATQVSRAIGEVSASAERQATGMRESDELLGDLRAAAARSAGAGQRVVAVADGIRCTAALHQGHLGAASETLLELHEVVERTTSSVDRLTKAAESVLEFVSLTGQLAAQTELLALNAAIEAARAGGAGEGFAVVAGEIRQLAETSAEGARRIAKTVATLDEQVRLVAATVGAGKERVAGVEGVAGGVTRALAEIVGSVEEVSAAAGTVAREAAAHRELADRLAATAADVARSAQINAHAAQAVTDSAEEQSSATVEITTAATTLVATADRLNQLVTGFRV